MTKPNPLDVLVGMARQYGDKTKPPVIRAMALYTMREVVAEHELDLMLVIDHRMREFADNLPEKEKEDLRALGYNFDEDLENVKEFLKGGASE